MIKFGDVYANLAEKQEATAFLYELLKERDATANISHREMPTFEQHCAFVNSKPYQCWYIVYTKNYGNRIGAIYLTKLNEIGISIKKEHQGHGYGKQAVRGLMQLHPANRFLANVAPRNVRSIQMFEELGFETLQVTLAKEMK